MKATGWKFGVSTAAVGDVNRDIFEAYARAKVDMMEISLTPEKSEALNWAETRKSAEENGVKIWSFHLPFYPSESNNIASLDKAVRKNTVCIQTEYIKKSSELGAEIVVIHPSGEPNKDGERNEQIKCAKECLSQLADTASECGVRIAVENIPRTCIGNCSAEIKKLIEDDERLGVCFDSNHLLIEDNKSFIEALGNKIITVHISDYDFLNERHWLPYEGKIDWIELVGALENAGYSGPFMYELSLEAPPTINRRMLTLEDLRKNYEACINKTPAEKIGTIAEAECIKSAYLSKPI